MTISIKKVSSVEDIQLCLNIRKTVFILGQNVPEDLEVDGKDQSSDHYLLTVDHIPAGTARVRYIQDAAKIERVAVLDMYRGRGFGEQIMRSILTDLQSVAGIMLAKLGSQTQAVSFYEKLGFVVCSEEYMDANIPHRDMQLLLHRG